MALELEDFQELYKLVQKGYAQEPYFSGMNNVLIDYGFQPKRFRTWNHEIILNNLNEELKNLENSWISKVGWADSRQENQKTRLKKLIDVLSESVENLPLYINDDEVEVLVKWRLSKGR